MGTYAMSLGILSMNVVVVVIIYVEDLEDRMTNRREKKEETRERKEGQSRRKLAGLGFQDILLFPSLRLPHLSPDERTL
jgi:hypothetical protein